LSSSSSASSYSSLSSSSSTPPNECKGRILIVDDEPEIVQLFALALEDDGFIVDTYNDPLIALSKFKIDLYDLLLVDIRLPNMDGFELYGKIRNMDKRIKVCFISAYQVNYLALRDQYPGLEIDCVIPKPVKIEDLVKIVNEELQ
jgi:DNA-binding response OmpR family regulator